MDTDVWETHSWSTSQEYYKGDLENLEIWVKGDVRLICYKKINLFDENGVFFKTELTSKVKDEFLDIRVDNRLTKKEVIQVDYNFYLIPVSERHSLASGREKTFQMLKDFKIKGFERYGYSSDINIEHSWKFEREKYTINRPLEICFKDEYRFNTLSFMEFSYKKYIKNYEDFIIKNPVWENEALQLKRTNLFIILDFYDVSLKVLSRNNFDRLKYAIRALNIKINNKIKNQ